MGYGPLDLIPGALEKDDQGNETGRRTKFGQVMATLATNFPGAWAIGRNQPAAGAAILARQNENALAIEQANALQQQKQARTDYTAEMLAPLAQQLSNLNLHDPVDNAKAYRIVMDHVEQHPDMAADLIQFGMKILSVAQKSTAEKPPGLVTKNLDDGSAVQGYFEGGDPRNQFHPIGNPYPRSTGPLASVTVEAPDTTLSELGLVRGRVATEIAPLIKGERATRVAMSSARSAFETGNPQDAQAAILNSQQALQEGAVLGAEFVRTEEFQSLGSKVDTLQKRLTTGGVSDELLRNIYDTSRRINDLMRREAEIHIQPWRDIVKLKAPDVPVESVVGSHFGDAPEPFDFGRATESIPEGFSPAGTTSEGKQMVRDPAGNVFVVED